MKNKVIKEIYSNVFLVTYSTQYDLCMDFVRVQEFYESPKFKGRYFSLEEFMDWWSHNMSRNKGSFDYPIRWNGFNITSDILLKWLSKCGHNILRDREISLLNFLAKKLGFKVGEAKTGYDFYDLFKNNKRIYIIACHKESSKRAMDEVIDHEVAHAFYNLYSDYKKACITFLNAMDKDKNEKIIKDYACEDLIKKGYHKSVIKDELQAYFSTGNDFGVRQNFVDNLKYFKNKIK